MIGSMGAPAPVNSISTSTLEDMLDAVEGFCREYHIEPHEVVGEMAAMLSRQAEAHRLRGQFDVRRRTSR
jgi:hypothetical protein